MEERIIEALSVLGINREWLLTCLANLRLSESLLKDKELMGELINVLEKYK